MSAELKLRSYTPGEIAEAVGGKLEIYNGGSDQPVTAVSTNSMF